MKLAVVVSDVMEMLKGGERTKSNDPQKIQNRAQRKTEIVSEGK